MSMWFIEPWYEIIDGSDALLGEGTFGSVIKCRSRRTQRDLAVKIIDNVDRSPCSYTSALREIQILRKLKHPCIMPLLHAMMDSDHNLYLVFEEMEKDLDQTLQNFHYWSEQVRAYPEDYSNQVYSFSLFNVKYIMYKLLEGLRYLHSCNVIHRDIKPGNILFKHRPGLLDVKIADFGFARVVPKASILDKFASLLRESDTFPPNRQQSNSPSSLSSMDSFSSSSSFGAVRIESPEIDVLLTKHVVTRSYRAPEVALLEKYTSAVDLWSLGCVFAELLGLLQSPEQFRMGCYKRKPLFPSASNKTLDTRDRLSTLQNQLHDNGSLLNSIFDVLGTPRKSEMQWLPMEKRDLLIRSPKKYRQNLSQRFPFADKSSIDLLWHLLKFDPTQRCTATEGICHATFESLIDHSSFRLFLYDCSHSLPVGMDIVEAMEQEVYPAVMTSLEDELALFTESA